MTTVWVDEMTETTRRLADLIAEDLLCLGLTDDEGAQACGMHETQYVFFITGERPPPHPAFCSTEGMAGLLGITKLELTRRLLDERKVGPKEWTTRR